MKTLSLFPLPKPPKRNAPAAVVQRYAEKVLKTNKANDELKERHKKLAASLRPEKKTKSKRSKRSR